MSDPAFEVAALRRWLFEAALPLWWRVGADHVRGGFHDAIDLDGTPVPRPRRARSIARQVFAYCEAGRLGWNGPWREASRHALDHLRGHFVSADATVASAVGLDGHVHDPTFDLYNQAFALLAFAEGYGAIGGDTDCRKLAIELRAALAQRCAHPAGGFREDHDGRLPQRSNPHMHLFEAALAWTAIDHDPAWQDMADAIAQLCLERFIDPATGALREFFAADWSPAPGLEGRIAEPGHHYEWAFLLRRWAKSGGREAPPAAARLIAFADRHGIDQSRGVAINAVLTDGSVHDSAARLWAQAERVRVYAAERGTSDAPSLAAALAGLRRFLATPTAGLWYDQLTADDRMVAEPARATSLYHIMGAAAALAAALPRQWRA